MRALVFSRILLSLIFSFLLTSASAQQPSTIPFILAPPSPSAPPSLSGPSLAPDTQEPVTSPPAITAPPVPADPSVSTNVPDMRPTPPGGPVFGPLDPNGRGARGEAKGEARPLSPDWGRASALSGGNPARRARGKRAGARG